MVEVEESALPASRSGSPWRLRYSTTMALVISILGSSVLPMSYAFSKTGILLGCLVSLVRAGAGVGGTRTPRPRTCRDSYPFQLTDLQLPSSLALGAHAQQSRHTLTSPSTIDRTV